MAHQVYSPGARPDVRIKKRGRVYQLLEVKVLCPISSNADRTDFNGTYAAFANTAPAKRSEIAEKYAPAKTNGHTVVPCVFEVFGGAVPETTRLLGEWSKAARAATPPGEEPPWCARNYMPYWSQIISAAAQRGVAAEIMTCVREETSVRAVLARGG